MANRATDRGRGWVRLSRTRSGQTALDVASLGRGRLEFQRGAVRPGRLVVAAHPGQQIGAGDMNAGPPGELGVTEDHVEDGQAGGGPRS